jgi:hypothetical protein
MPDEVSKNGLQFFKLYFWTIFILAVAMPTSRRMDNRRSQQISDLLVTYAFLDEKAI